MKLSAGLARRRKGLESPKYGGERAWGVLTHPSRRVKPSLKKSVALPPLEPDFVQHEEARLGNGESGRRSGKSLCPTPQNLPKLGIKA